MIFFCIYRMKRHYFTHICIRILCSIGAFLVGLPIFSTQIYTQSQPSVSIALFTNSITQLTNGLVTFTKRYAEVHSGEVTVLVIGDVNTAGLTGEYMNASGATPFQFVESTLKSYDLTVANLEANISEPEVGYPQPDKPYTFKGPVRTLDTMLWAGIDVVSIANNHTMDYTATALVRMMELLNEKNIVFFGGGSSIDEAFAPKYITKKGVRFGFVTANEIENYYTMVRPGQAGTTYFDATRLEQAIRTAKANADIVIVMPHWGEEHNPNYNGSQQWWAHAFIDWGADIIIGNHPHIIQGSEIYNGKYIFYSLGNFIASGFSWSETAVIGEQVFFTVKNKQITNVGTKRVEIDYNGFPKFMN